MSKLAARTVVCTNSGITWRDSDSYVFVHRDEYLDYYDLETTVMEQIRLFLNGKNDLPFVFERLQARSLNPEANL